ncbi:hypothetical protein B0H63DRAFT_515998 [Podospora didyma]|uniref:Mid2 domain-containing protein n=1 Tax=Podospora didyma TaxID=330526 RepID=A0AAE0P3Z3_9PEZI|nr:hypothetical protein B0H63DRAFT_515998 [Podospora didyma]
MSTPVYYAGAQIAGARGPQRAPAPGLARIAAVAAALLLLGLFADCAAADATTCYRLDGLPHTKIRPDDGDWIPCDSTATVSSCCSSKDYCLGNGLCLDAGANNYFSIQGCTDASWPQPCVSPTPKCKDNIRDEYSFVFPCSQATNASFNYCCGQTADCCTNNTNFLTFPGATEIRRPTVLPPSGSGTSAAATVTVTVAAAPGQGEFAGSTTPTPGSDSKPLWIGLGVGLALVAALVGLLVFFGCQLRKRRKEPKAFPVPVSPDLDKPPLGTETAAALVHDYHQQPQYQGSPYQQQFPSGGSTPVLPYNYSPQAPAPNVYQRHQGASYQGVPGAGQGEAHELQMGDENIRNRN